MADLNIKIKELELKNPVLTASGTFGYGIEFDYINENPECKDTALCSFAQKFFFDILLEDKAGFVGETDWIEIQDALIRMGEWDKKLSHEKA